MINTSKHLLLAARLNLSGGRTLPALVRLTNQNRVKVLLQPCELQLPLCDLIQGDPQQAVLMKLAQVMDTWW